MQRWREVALSAKVMQRREDLGWMNSNDYLSLAKHSLKRKVLAPLRARGIPVSDHDEALAEL